MRYPPAERLDVVDVMHGHSVADPYRWLEAADSAQSRAWGAAQDVLCRDHLAGLPGRDHLRERMTALLAAGYIGAPAWRAQRSFFMRRDPSAEHAVLFVREPDAAPRPLVDPMALDPSGLTTLDAWQPSKEGDFLAYQCSTGGDEESLLRVLDVQTGEGVDGPIGRTRYSPVAWLPGGKAFYYVRKLAPDAVPVGEEQFHRRVWLHRLGDDADTDVLVFGEGSDKSTYFDVVVSLDGRWLVVSAAVGTEPRNDVWIADLTTSVDAPIFAPIQVGVDAQTDAHVARDGRLYLHTDDGAPRGRLCVARPESPSIEHWVDLLPEDQVAVLEAYTLTNDAVVALHTRHAVSEVSLHDLSDGALRYSVTLPGVGSIDGLTSRPEGGHDVWFGYTDFVTPSRVFHLDVPTQSVTLYADPPGTVSAPEVEASQEFYESRDGTQVPIFVIAPRGRSSPVPCVLTGYGGFGVSMTPAYSAGINAWVEAGGVYAIACLRGGGEEGEGWHRAGMRGHKQNVFDDLHAAAEFLCQRGYTTAAALGIAGGSNGGLLVGAALTQRPELYRAVACAAPLLDMARYEQFGLGTTWRDEYGSADDPTELGWLLAYSPYHQVRDATNYPATLFTVFDSDTRVDPMHARKMCAALQAATASDRPVLIRAERDVGHGARSLTRSIDLAVDTTAFLAAELGLMLR